MMTTTSHGMSQKGISDTSTKRFIDSPPIPLGPNAARASLDVAVLPSALLEGTRNTLIA